MTLSEERVIAFMQERGWDKVLPGDVAKSIMIEGAELLELFQWKNPTFDEVKNDAQKLEKIKKELADVLIYAIDLSTLLGLSMEDIIAEKLESNGKKYPAALMKNSATAGEDYWRIKEEHRRQNG